jgi:hypothetical protein
MILMICAHIVGCLEQTSYIVVQCTVITLWNFVNMRRTPNVMVEWLTLVLRIREVRGSYLGPKTGILTKGFLSPSSKIP